MILISISIAIYGGMSFYVGKRLYQGLAVLFPYINSILFAAIFTLIASTLFVGIMPVPVMVRRLAFRIGAHWIGFFVYLFLLFLCADVVVFLGSITTLIAQPGTARFYTTLAAVLLTVILVIYGRYNARRIRHVHYEIQTKTASFPSGIKIVLISDVHFGAVNSEKNLARIVKGINDLKPDLVCIAGDIFNDDVDLIRDPFGAIRLFRKINATYGVYASLGNHDGGVDLGKMLAFLEESNITVLKDEHAVIDGRLVLIGRLDRSPIGGFGGLERKDLTDVLALIDAQERGLPIVVMDHNPAAIKEYGNKVDVILSGHTHGGQVFPATLLTKALFTVHYGHYQKDADSPHMVVTSGISTWGMPMRIGSNNEIVSITLH